jgi:hypothetical protein
MKNGLEHNCGEAREEDLLLLAYGESDDPRLTAHAATCPACQAYLAAVKETRAFAADGLIKPAESVVKAVQTQAHALLPKPGGEGWWARLREWSFGFEDRGWRAWAPAMAVAAMVLAAGIAVLMVERERTGRPATGENASREYLLGVDEQLSEAEGYLQKVLPGGEEAKPRVNLLALVLLKGDSAAAPAGNDEGTTTITYSLAPSAGDSGHGSAKVDAPEAEFSLDPGHWSLIMEDEERIGAMELAMTELEDQMELSTLGTVSEQKGD